MLGPHTNDGAVTVRVFRPLAKTVRVTSTTDGGQEERVDLDHEYAGVWVGVLPVADVPDYRVEVRLRRAASSTRRRPVPLPAHARRDRPAPDRRGPPRAALDGARARTCTATTGRTGPVDGHRRFAVWAPTRAGRARHRRLQQLGRPRAPDALARAARACGSCSCPTSAPGTRYKFEILGADGAWRDEGRPDGLPHRGPAGDGVGGLRVVLHAGATTTGWPHAAPAQAARGADERLRGAPRLVAQHGAVRYRELADELVDVRRRPRLHPRRVAAGGGAPVRRLVGLPGHVVLRADGAVRRPRRLPLPGRPAAPGRHRRDRRLGAGALPEGRLGAGPLRRHAAVRARRPARAASTPTGARYVFDFGRREVRNFLVANALYWLEEFHIDGLRVDAVASMLYLDYSREAGEWMPNVHGGRENLEAVAVPPGDERHRLQASPRRRSRSPRSRPRGRASPARRTSGGLGFGFKWNMGWMHDTLGYFEHEPVHRRYHHNELTFSLMYAYSRELRAAAVSHDEVVHGKGSLLRKMPGDRWQQLANLRAYLALHVGPPRQAAALHGRRVRPGVGVGRGPRARLVAARPLRAPRACTTLVARPQPRLPRLPGALGADHDPDGFPWIDANDAGRNVFSFVRHGADGRTRRWSASPTSPAIPHDDYRLGLPVGRPRGTRSLNTDADGYAGSGVGNLGAIEAVDGRPRRPARVRHRRRSLPLATVWFRKRAELTRRSAGERHRAMARPVTLTPVSGTFVPRGLGTDAVDRRWLGFARPWPDESPSSRRSPTAR